MPSNSIKYSRLSKQRRNILLLFLVLLCMILALICAIFFLGKRSNGIIYDEKHRPQFHFSQPQHWMNDPNGLVYNDGVYHLFYQFNPGGKIWGPMHWGHAVSTDLLHWKHEPIALFPNKLGTIFSGCALVDSRNVTGLQSSSNKVLIAIFTQHFQNETVNQLQQQSLAFSEDAGLSWSVYEMNPIIKNPGILDFRDPKVIEYKDHYIMALAAVDRIIFYKSFNLLNWQKLSEFGVKQGAHSGVWECPDLFEVQLGSKHLWVLLVSINPGGPNGGSATQYFVGYFDGTKFVNRNSPETVLWLDYGPDSYAGVTWFGAPKNKHLFIAWMNNWNYANFVPTDPWRGQMTIPRTLQLHSLENGYFISSFPVNETYELRQKTPLKILSTSVQLTANQTFSQTLEGVNKQLFDISLTFDVTNLEADSALEACFRNDAFESICVKYLKRNNSYMMDRSSSGNIHFHQHYNLVSTAPRFLHSCLIDWRLLLDVSSLEVFADNGLTTLTSLYFSKAPLTDFDLKLVSKNETSVSNANINSMSVYSLQSVWT